ncbi:MAG: DUF1449 family protein, partial [bacterium]|nr:DUF1449 family protein [bacterium]
MDPQPTLFEYLPFCISLLLGFGALASSIFGGADHDHNVDHDASFDHGGVDHDAGHGGTDHDHDGEGSRNALDLTPSTLSRWRPSKILAGLGFGRVPLTILIMIYFFMFAVFGLVVTTLVKPHFSHVLWVSVPVASIATLFCAGKLARLINHVFPTSETYVTSDEGLVGRGGKLIVDVNTTTGFVDVADEYGAIHQVLCRTY